MLDDLFARRIDGRLDDRLVFAAGLVVADRGAEVLMAGLVLDVQQHAPDEVRGEAAQQHHHQHRQPLPQVGRAVPWVVICLMGLPASSP